MNVKRKIPSVNLRQRELASGRIQLYLDITIDGKRKRESLNMFLEPSRTKVDREKNKETLAIAHEMAEKRRKEEIDRANGVDVNDNGFYTRFFDYFKKCSERRTGNTRKNWDSTMFHLHVYEDNSDITLLRINKDWLEGLKDYFCNRALQYHYDKSSGKNIPMADNRRLSESTAQIHYSRIVTCLNSAMKEGLIQFNPAKKVDGIKCSKESGREHLTRDELKRLLDTPMPHLLIKRNVDNTELASRAIVFSLMTGLRMSDVQQLKWDMISVDDSGRYRITFRQQKTGGMMYLDINKRASEQLGERSDSSEPIFNVSDACLNQYLKRWIHAAGIKKKFTFHCCRHTFATLTLQAGVDLYTTSKLLGHSNINTTQIYAKIVDEQKQSAVDRLEDFI